MSSLTSRQASVIRVLSEHSGSFEWGQRDCVTLAADVVHAVRGAPVVDVSWRSAADATAEIARRGGLRAAVTDLLGEPYDQGAQTPMDGDVVLVQIRGVEMLGVWAGDSPIGPAARGLHRLPADCVVAAWRV